MRRVRALAKQAGDVPEAYGLATGACIWILQFGWRQGLADDEVESVFEELIAIADRTDNDWVRAAAYGAHAVARGMVGDVRGAYEGALEGRRIARETGALGLEIVVGDEYWLDLLGETRAALAGLEEAMERIGEDYELGRDVIGFSPLIWSIYFRGYLLCVNGRLEESRRENDRALALAREHDDVESLGWAQGGYGFLEYYSGEIADGLAHTRDAVELAERTGSAFSRLTAYWSLGLDRLVRHEWADAVDAFEESLRLIRETHTGMQYEGLFQGALA
jgi:tetratricopeptide (TPR) repeat protein